MYSVKNKKDLKRKTVSVIIASALIAGAVPIYGGFDNDQTLRVYAAQQTVNSSDTDAEDNQGINADDGTKSPLINLSAAEKDTVFFGETVKVNGIAGGGSGDYTYSYMYKPSVKETWSKMTDGYVKDETASFVPKTKGVYDVQVKVKDGEGNIAVKDFSVTVDEVSLLKNNSSVNAKNVNVGDNIRITAKHSGGKSEFKYAFYFKRKSSLTWKVLGTEFGTSRTASFKPLSSAVYDIRVDIKDASGQLASKSFTVSASSGVFENISAVSKYKFTNFESPIRLYGIGVGGEGKYTYAYYFKRSVNTRWNAIGNTFGTQTETRFYPTAYTDYDVKIDVKDETGAVVSKTFTIVSENREPLENTSYLNENVFEPGQKIIIKGSASGGTAPYKYTYRFKRSINTNWKTIGDSDTSSPNADITPTSEGMFDIEVTVKDAEGRTSVKTTNAAVYDVKNLSEISNESIMLGESAEINAKASGGIGEYRYAYYYRLKGSESWTANGNEFSENDVFLITPEQAGEYEVLVRIKDGSGIIAEKISEFKVYNKLLNLSEISNTTVEKGKAVILTASAEGGTGEYTYAYYYRKFGSNAWYLISDGFTDQTEARMNPPAVTTYYFKVVVKDSSGRTAEKEFTVSVKASGGNELPIVPAI